MYLTSFPIHNTDSLNKQWTVGLSVFHKHYQQLQSCLHNQPRLKRIRTRKIDYKEAAFTIVLEKMAASNLSKALILYIIECNDKLNMHLQQ